LWLLHLKVGVSACWDVVADAVSNFQNNGDTNQAAAISLYAILSFITLFILTFLMAGHLFGAYPDIQRELMEGIQRASPSAAQGLLAGLGALEDRQRGLGWIGIITLVWFSSMIFGAIETALDMIFRSRKHRNYIASKLLATAMIPLAWAVGIMSIVVTSIAALVAGQPLLVESGLPYMGFIQGATFRHLIPYAVTVLFFTLVYKITPTVRIPLGVALTGSAIFAALMELAKHVFTWYVANYTRYNIIYGPLETVIVVLLWVFYIALILLFCAEIMSSYMRRDMLLLEKAFFKPGKNGATQDERLVRKFGRVYRRGSYIFREGDHDHDMYYILSGRVRVEKNAGHVRKTLSDLEPGEYFGEMAPLIDAPRTASAQALEDSTLAVIDRKTFLNFLRENEGMSLFMLREFSNRVLRINVSLEETTRAWLRLLVILYLLKAWSPEGRRDFMAELLELTGKERGEIENCLDDLTREGIIAVEDGRVSAFHSRTAWTAVLKGTDRGAEPRRPETAPPCR
jgi:membrane protein